MNGNINFSRWLSSGFKSWIVAVIVFLIIVPLAQYFYSGYERAVSVFWRVLGDATFYTLFMIGIYVPMFVSEYLVKGVANESLRQGLSLLLGVVMAFISLGIMLFLFDWARTSLKS